MINTRMNFLLGLKYPLFQIDNDVNDNFNLIGLGITEHLPWAAIKLAKLLQELPLIK